MSPSSVLSFIDAHMTHNPKLSSLKDNLLLSRPTFCGSGIWTGHRGNVNGDCSQTQRRLRPRRAAVEQLGKITRSKDVSLETQAQIPHTLVFPVTVYRCESWTGRRLTGKNKLFI